MSVEVLRQVFAHPHDSAKHQLMLVALAWKSIDLRGGVAEVSQRQLVALTGMPRWTVRRVVDDLISEGRLVVDWADNGRRNRYRVNVGDLAVPQSVDELAETPAHQLALPVDNPVEKGVPEGSEISTGGPPRWPGVGRSDGPHKKEERKEERASARSVDNPDSEPGAERTR